LLFFQILKDTKPSNPKAVYLAFNLDTKSIINSELHSGLSYNKLFKKFIATTISSFKDKNVNIGKVFIPNSARRVNLEKYLALTYKFV
jgi:hypothetical protein